MISQQALFTQMELKLQQAKAAQNEAQLREAVSALQALCNVVLDSTTVQAEVMPVVQQQLVTPTVQQQQTPSKLDDANGASIFDF